MISVEDLASSEMTVANLVGAGEGKGAIAAIPNSAHPGPELKLGAKSLSPPG
jgi:hypothetical protein